jgi:hypothetical protein
MRQLLILPFLVSSLALAQTAPPPRIVTEHDGRMMTFRAEGSLESTQAIGCIPLTAARSTFTPPDLYLGVTECIAQDKYDDAAGLFALASVYGRFDAERVADSSAAQAKSVLLMNTFAAVPREKRTRLNEALGRITRSPELLRKLCLEVQRVGMPGYHPKYMILHGIEAFSVNPVVEPLRKDFDAQGFWKHLQTVYLHCQK